MGLHLRSLLGIDFSVPFPTVEEVTSKARKVRSYIVWDLLPVDLFGHSSSLSVRLLWLLGHNNVPGNDTNLFFHNDALYSVLIFMEVNQL